MINDLTILPRQANTTIDIGTQIFVKSPNGNSRLPGKIIDKIKPTGINNKAVESTDG